MPLLSKSSPFARLPPSSPPRHRSRREDSYILRGAAILRQQIKRQEDQDRSYAKLDPDRAVPSETPGNTTSSFSSEEDAADPWGGSPGRSPRRGRPSRDRTPPGGTPASVRDRIARAQASVVMPADDEGFLGAEDPPLRPLGDDGDDDGGGGDGSSRSSFSFLDDTQWAVRQTRLAGEEPRSHSPAWSVPAKNVSDEDGDPDLYGNDTDTDLEGMRTEYEECAASRVDPWLNDTLELGPGLRHGPPAVQSQSSPVTRHVPGRSASRSGRPPSRAYAHIPSPLSQDYAALLRDPAFRHALRAGHCWQSLVGQLVRFPPSWWQGRRGPPLGAVGGTGPLPAWQFRGRFHVQGAAPLRALIPDRASPGVLLLHLVVQDLVTGRPVQDVVVGAFHPNARGIRRTVEPDPRDEKIRDVWLAVRKHHDSISVVDTVLSSGRLDATKSPLGAHRVTNHNVRAVFGDHPPLGTLCLSEDRLYERLAWALEASPQSSPAEALLREFVF